MPPVMTEVACKMKNLNKIIFKLSGEGGSTRGRRERKKREQVSTKGRRHNRKEIDVIKPRMTWSFLPGQSQCRP